MYAIRSYYDAFIGCQQAILLTEPRLPVIPAVSGNFCRNPLQIIWVDEPRIRNPARIKIIRYITKLPDVVGNKINRPALIRLPGKCDGRALVDNMLQRNNFV